VGLKINPKTAEVEWRYARTLDPYGVYPDLPEECQQVGRATYGSTFTTCRRRSAMCGRREPQQHDALPHSGQVNFTRGVETIEIRCRTGFPSLQHFHQRDK
jgi:hypothetical protein